MTFTEAKKYRDLLENTCDRFDDELKKFPKGNMGLTPDIVKTTPEWKNAKQSFDKAFAQLREFNRIFTKEFKKELLQERKFKQGISL